jgi:hypothetical protein
MRRDCLDSSQWDERERSPRVCLTLRGNTQPANITPRKPGLYGWYKPGLLCNKEKT